VGCTSRTFKAAAHGSDHAWPKSRLHGVGAVICGQRVVLVHELDVAGGRSKNSFTAAQPAWHSDQICAAAFASGHGQTFLGLATLTRYQGKTGTVLGHFSQPNVHGGYQVVDGRRQRLCVTDIGQRLSTFDDGLPCFRHPRFDPSRPYAVETSSGPTQTGSISRSLAEDRFAEQTVSTASLVWRSPGRHFMRIDLRQRIPN